jgi:hypothetical protein
VVSVVLNIVENCRVREPFAQGLGLKSRRDSSTPLVADARIISQAQTE